MQRRDLSFSCAGGESVRPAFAGSKRRSHAPNPLQTQASRPGEHTHGVTEEPLPSRGERDSDESWGEEPQDNEERLESERPPHHDDRG